MNWYLSIFSFILILIGTLSLALAITGWRLRPAPGALPFAAMMGAAALWSFTYGFEISTTDYLIGIIILSIEIVAIAVIPVFWLLFVLEYTGRDQLITDKIILLLLIIPAIAIIAFITAPIFHLYFTAFTPNKMNGFIKWTFTYGPVFLIHVVYSLILVFSGFIVIIEQYIEFPAYRKQIAALIIAWLIPTATVIMDAADMNPILGLDITPFALLLSGLILIAAIRKYNFLSLMPIAHGVLLGSLTDGFIVLNPQDIIIDLNPVASEIIGKPVNDLLANAIGPSFPGILPVLSQCRNSQDVVCDVINLKQGGGIHYYNVQCRQIFSSRKVQKGRLILLRDISDLERSNSALTQANQKLNLISTITRHDLANQMTVLDGYFTILREEVQKPESQAFIQKIESSISIIRRELEFMQEYQSLGSKEFRWQKISDVIIYAKSHLDTTHISVTTKLDGLYVYSDPLLEKALMNLLENSIRHGEHVKTITFTYTLTSDGVTLIYEDDGVGIANDEKEQIFKRGYGRNLGLGLYLVRVILSISGMAIKETGIPGKGARFEITIPEGMFFFTGEANQELING
jgi:signal transduction histidine kinase